jgi:hypothetical protein
MGARGPRAHLQAERIKPVPLNFLNLQSGLLGSASRYSTTLHSEDGAEDMFDQVHRKHRYYVHQHNLQGWLSNQRLH